jgi:hypothetical protein
MLRSVLSGKMVRAECNCRNVDDDAVKLSIIIFSMQKESHVVFSTFLSFKNSSNGSSNSRAGRDCIWGEEKRSFALVNFILGKRRSAPIEVEVKWGISINFLVLASSLFFIIILDAIVVIWGRRENHSDEMEYFYYQLNSELVAAVAADAAAVASSTNMDFCDVPSRLSFFHVSYIK